MGIEEAQAVAFAGAFLPTFLFRRMLEDASRKGYCRESA